MRTCPSVSVVVIGLNEENNLADCLESILQSELQPCEIVYVDGGSVDSSVDIADSYHSVRVIELRSESPTPGKGRNEGLRHCRGELVQFVDGDMVLVSTWLKQAVPELLGNERTLCVFGCTKEKNRSSLFDWVLSVDWETKPLGEVLAPSGGGLFRTKALQEIGGYAESLAAAEETELGERIRKAGYRIFSLNELMAYHNLGMRSLGDCWRRGLRSGKAQAQLVLLDPHRLLNWRTLKSEIYVVLFFVTLLMAIVFHSWSLLGGLATVGILLVYRQSRLYNRRVQNWLRSGLFGVHVYLAMVPSSVGFTSHMLRHVWLSKARDRKKRKEP